jgi:DNA-binding FadR family transcriptional regulator
MAVKPDADGEPVSGEVHDTKSLRTLERRPLYRQVQEAIKKYIITNRLEAGDALPPEGELATQLGISRNSVREGVKALQVLGVVDSRVGSGMFVRPFSFDPIFENLPYSLIVDLGMVEDMLELRRVLDLGIAADLIEAVTPVQLASLTAILDDWSASDAYRPALDQAFHQRLYGILDNVLIRRLGDVFWQTYRQVAAPHDENPVDSKATLRLHENIVAALAAGDVDLLRSAIDDHYPGIWRDLIHH